MTWHFARCELDPATRSLMRDGEEVAVEPRVFDLLLYLVENSDRYVPRDELLDRIWPDAVVGPAALSRAIKEARRAVGDDGQRQTVIATLHGRGYRLIAPARHAGNGDAAETKPPPAAGSRPPELPTVPRARTATDQQEAGAPGIAWCYPEYRAAAPFPARGKQALGRGKSCDVTLPGLDLSRHHAELFKDGPIYVLRDLGSTNGSFVNGKQIATAAVACGDVVRLGDTVGVVVAGAGDASEAHTPRPLWGELFGSGVLAAALAPLRAAARTRCAVVIEGETGSGKRTAAEALHHDSGRAGALVRVSGEGLGGEALREAYAAARGGSLLLAQASELTTGAQQTLLALLRAADASSARLIAVSERRLREAQGEGQLGAELYRELGGTTAVMPPLRTRVCDLPGLLSRFLSRLGSDAAQAFSAGLIEQLCLYDWPFNVGELRWLARKLTLDHPGVTPLRSSHLPAHMVGPADANVGAARAGETPIGRLTAALRKSAGDVARASRELRISTQEARRLMCPE